jgi:hypothetical protein
MSNRNLYLLAAGVGGTIGGFLPALWGAGEFSGWGILLSMVGSFAGLWAVHRFFIS